jgi:hypothetical protein
MQSSALASMQQSPNNASFDRRKKSSVAKIDNSVKLSFQLREDNDDLIKKNQENLSKYINDYVSVS